MAKIVHWIHDLNEIMSLYQPALNTWENIQRKSPGVARRRALF